VEAERQRQSSTRLIEQHALNKQSIEARVEGKIGYAGFEIVKPARVAEQPRKSGGR
jgi:hypothetical protein